MYVVFRAVSRKDEAYDCFSIVASKAQAVALYDHWVADGNTDAVGFGPVTELAHAPRWRKR